MMSLFVSAHVANDGRSIRKAMDYGDAFEIR